jgi:hypothetical protein
MESNYLRPGIPLISCQDTNSTRLLATLATFADIVDYGDQSTFHLLGGDWLRDTTGACSGREHVDRIVEIVYEDRKM